MKCEFIFDNLIFIVLFIANIKVEDYNYYFKLIYTGVIIYNIYGLFCSLKDNWKKNQYKFVFFIVFSLILYYFSYNYIYDINPQNYAYFYYLFYPNFLKAILIVFMHTFIVSKLYKGINFRKYERIKECEFGSFSEVKISNGKHDEETSTEVKNSNYYFLSFYINYFLNHKTHFLIFFLSVIIIITLQVILFIHRIKIWVYYNNKSKTLPIATAKNTTFFIAATIHNMEKTIDDYIIELKKLINYLGKENVIISFVENGDSKDKTQEKLINFMTYLNESEIVHRFILDHEIDDPRINDTDPYQSLEDNFLSNLRIKFYSELRNRCLDFIYEIPNLNFSNTKVIFFNDIIFEYENIINLLSTNNEDYDAVCGLDFYDCFYDSWVSIDLSGYSLRHDFPYFVNKEGQDLVINHKPIRVFSCWNGVMAFTAEPLKDKKIQFRYELNPNREIQYFLNSDQQYNYESECTYFHIDLHALGYQKKFINPEVRVAYEYKYYYLQKIYYPNQKEENAYKKLYEESKGMKRNKDMSNYKDKKITLNNELNNFYLANKLQTYNNTI
jgi:flavodoxin